MIVVFFIIYGCKNDLEKIHAFSEGEIVPSLSGKGISILRSDSGFVNLKISAPAFKRYDQIREPYIEFPEGVEVFFLDSLAEVKTYIRSKYAIYYEEQELWYARDSVVVENNKNKERLISEEMYWDEKREMVYSDKFTTIEKPDGTYHGRKGFEASQDFSRWKLKQMYGRGIITEKDED